MWEGSLEIHFLNNWAQITSSWISQGKEKMIIPLKGENDISVEAILRVVELQF